jgi:hypothetical protein
MPGAMSLEQCQVFDGQMWVQQPMALLQNEVGSIVMPQTWRYVPPPQLPPMQQATNLQPCDNGEPNRATPDLQAQTSAIATSQEEQSVIIIRPVHDREETQAPTPVPLSIDAKRKLLNEVVECLATRGEETRKALEGEQRSNRSMQVTMEVLQRQNVTLQQQLAWVLQSVQPAYGAQPSEDGSTVWAPPQQIPN